MNNEYNHNHSSSDPITALQGVRWGRIFRIGIIVAAVYALVSSIDFFVLLFYYLRSYITH
jgi:hypothetical protein